MRSAALTGALLLGTGCLGDLVKPAGRDGGPDDGGGGPDARAVDAGDTAAWPDDLAIRVTTLVHHLNDNRYPDLVLLNDPATADDRGLLVLFDRPDGFFAAPDQFLSTAPLRPLVAAAEDVVGDATLDLIVIASDEGMDPYVQVFEGMRGSRFDDSRAAEGFPAYDLSAGTVDAPTPVFAAPVQIRDGTRRDLVFGDLDSAVALAPDDWDDLGAADPFGVDVSTTMNTAVAIPSVRQGREDLFVADNDGGWWLENSGAEAGGFEAGPSAFGLWDDNARAFAAFDLQPDGIPDLMTLDRDILTVAVLVFEDGSLKVQASPLDPAPQYGDSNGEAIAAADIDGIAGMDLLILDNVDGDGAFGLLAARNIDAGPIFVEPASRRVDADHTHVGEPTRMVVGDFDHDAVVEVWVFDQTLADKLCLVGEVYNVDNYRFNECE